MKKIIRQYLCDHCGKEVEEKVENDNPLYSIGLRIDDVFRNGYYLNTHLQLCDDCNKKLMKDIDSVVSFLSNHWGNEEEES